MRRKHSAKEGDATEGSLLRSGPIKPSGSDIETARNLRQIVRRGGADCSLRLTVIERGLERTVDLTQKDFPVLAEALTQIAKGKAVFVLPVDHELSTQQAADLLNVSRPFLIKLLENNQIPFRTVGAWRRVRLNDVLAYKRRSDDRSKAALQELADQAQGLKLGY